VGRHRHVVNVRTDGIAEVLGPLLRDARITAAALVDVGSGMVLDAWSAAGPTAPTGVPDLELIGAQHAEVVRCALALLRTWPRPDRLEPAGPEDDTCEVVLGADGGCHHLLRTVPDPHGDRLALAVVVDGPPRVLERVRKRLRSVAVDAALTAGPSMSRRPVRGAWLFGTLGPDVPAAGIPAVPAPPQRAEGGPFDGVRLDDLAEPDDVATAVPAPEPPVPGPTALPPPALPQWPPRLPALSRLGTGPAEPSRPHDGHPAPAAAPSPPVAAPPRSAQVGPPSVPAASPPQPVRPSPPVGTRPSPPAALPAPPQPRRP
jgi:hypothetical protein